MKALIGMARRKVKRLAPAILVEVRHEFVVVGYKILVAALLVRVPGGIVTVFVFFSRVRYSIARNGVLEKAEQRR